MEKSVLHASRMQPNSDYGSAPGPEEIEFTLLGPGYGEAVVAHLGHGSWMLVDSCIEKGSSRSASIEYLDALGVPDTAVKFIIASHWHDDHIRGLRQLVEKYSKAELFIPGIFSRAEALQFLAAYSGHESNALSRGTRELRMALEQRPTASAVKERTLICQSSKPALTVVAYSPTEPAFTDFLTRMFAYLPRKGQSTPINHAPDLQPNYSSIVLHVDLPEDAVLLGADLEDHDLFGWGALLKRQWCLRRKKASIFKVAHHGSKTGHNEGIWTEFLKPDPIALLTPFVRGRHSIPNAAEREMIVRRTPHAYLTTAASRKPKLPNEQLKRLRDICKSIQLTEQGFGAVRVRRNPPCAEWKVDLFGGATSLSKA